MEEAQQEPEDNNQNESEPEEVNFLSRFFLQPNELFSKEKYLLSIMRFSIMERILNIYLFQSTSKDFTLFPFLENVKKEQKSINSLNSIMKFCSEKFNEDYPLYFYSELSKEILRVLKEEDLSLMKFDKFILKIEFLLAIHFENNFFAKAIDNKIYVNLYENLHLRQGITNYIYSVECLNTIFNFVRTFEKQSLATRIENEFPLIHSLFCSEKIYYFYCDKISREKIPPGNIVKYLLEQINMKIENSKNAKINNYDTENYFMMFLYLVNHLVQFYTFYFHKKPELTEIYNGIKVLKNYPYPIGNFCNEVMENILNEILFQGTSILNKLRQVYFLDILDKKVNALDVKYFRGVSIIYPNEWEVRHKNVINTDHPDGFNLYKFVNRLKTKPKSTHNQKLIIREIVMKLLITIIINSKQIYSIETYKKIYDAFMPDYKLLYQKKNFKKEKEEKEENDENEDEDENPEKAQTENNNKSTYVPKETKIKTSLETLLKILDTGLDKTVEDFDKEINMIASKLIGIGGDPLNIQNDENDSEESILDTPAYLPINSLRNYLKPYYLEVKKIYRGGGEETNTTVFDLFETYTKNFMYVVNNYYKYLIDFENIEDNLVMNNLKILRKNFFNNFRINILLFEEDNTVNDFLELFQKNVLKNIDIKISNDNFNTFWKYFVDKKSEIIPKFILHIVPFYESCDQNPFKFFDNNDERNKFSKKYSYLSEYIATHDYIYKNIIFMPFSSCSDPAFFGYIPNCQFNNKNIIQFPTLDAMYSFIKKPLDFYLSDSNGILNLNIYKLTINDNENKLFWKNIEFLDKVGESKTGTKLMLTYVDYLGIEGKEEKEIKINGPFNIKIFNLFFNKDAPFYYNNNSNNNWLEMYLDDRLDEKEDEKFCDYNSFIQTNSDTKYYDEYNMPEMNIETRFKNYKVKKLIIETNSANLDIKFDDNNEYEYKNKIDFNQKGKEEYKIKITIEPFDIEGKKLTLPVATFTSL